MSTQKDLFSYQDEAIASEKKPKPLSVSDLNLSIKNTLENQYNQVWVKGEISNFKAHTSGHFYFSLKDARAQVNAVMFRGSNSKLKFRPKDGLEVLVRGQVGVYPPRGSYQVLCQSMEPVGQGGLKEEFERLKLKLRQEGLFNREHKKSLPPLTFRVALVTSPTGAAVRDMIQVLGRKHPACEVIVVPALTQGEKAAPDLIRALKEAEKIQGVDVILLARGGGSLEDMWCFNDEALARTIFDLKVSVVSGVGHEIDFTISDFVADLRAPTPSAAAELVCKNIEELREKRRGLTQRLGVQMQTRLRRYKEVCHYLFCRLIDPRKKLAETRMRVDELLARAEQALVKKVQFKKQGVIFLKTSLIRALSYNLNQNQNRFKQTQASLKALSPYGVLDRGYALVQTVSKGHVIKDPSKLKPNEELRVRVAQGEFKVQVKE